MSSTGYGTVYAWLVTIAFLANFLPQKEESIVWDFVASKWKRRFKPQGLRR